MYESFFDELDRISREAIKLAAAPQVATKGVKKLLPWMAAVGTGALGLHEGEKALRRYQLGKQVEEAQQAGQ